LLGEHPRGLVDLGLVAGQLRGLTPDCLFRQVLAPGLVPAIEEQDRREVRQDQSIADG
jgi:hypothetical protein